MKTKKISKIEKVYKTTSDTILIVTATTEGCAGRKYVSVTARKIKPVLKQEAVYRVREHLEDGDLWRMAVENKSTESSLSEWVEMVLGENELDGFDNSYYTETVKINNMQYIYESLSGGCLHDEILNVTQDFNTLIDLHIKDSKKSIEKAEKLISSMKSDNIDAEILKFSKQIISQTV